MSPPSSSPTRSLLYSTSLLPPLPSAKQRQRRKPFRGLPPRDSSSLFLISTLPPLPFLLSSFPCLLSYHPFPSPQPPPFVPSTRIPTAAMSPPSRYNPPEQPSPSDPATFRLCVSSTPLRATLDQAAALLVSGKVSEAAKHDPASHSPGKLTLLPFP